MIAQWNTQAIYHMRRGENKHALFILGQALQHLDKQHAATAITCDKEFAVYPTLETSRGGGSHKIPQEFYGAIPLTIERLTPMKQRAIEQDMPLYECAFHLGQTMTVTSETSLATISCVLLFNAAMACHREAMRICKSTAMKRVLALYEEVLARLQESQLLVQSNGGLLPLCAAVLHNLALVHGVCFFDRTQTRLLRQQLAQVLDWSAAISVLGKEDYVFFNVNLLCATGEDFRLAAAA